MALAKELLHHLNDSFHLLTTNPFAIAGQYHQHLYKLNEKVRLKKNNRTFETTINGVDENGFLVTNNTIDEKFGVGEVEWLH